MDKVEEYHSGGHVRQATSYDDLFDIEPTAQVQPQLSSPPPEKKQEQKEIIKSELNRPIVDALQRKIETNEQLFKTKMRESMNKLVQASNVNPVDEKTLDDFLQLLLAMTSDTVTLLCLTDLAQEVFKESEPLSQEATKERFDTLWLNSSNPNAKTTITRERRYGKMEELMSKALSLLTFKQLDQLTRAFYPKAVMYLIEALPIASDFSLDYVMQKEEVTSDTASRLYLISQLLGVYINAVLAEYATRPEDQKKQAPPMPKATSLIDETNLDCSWGEFIENEAKAACNFDTLIDSIKYLSSRVGGAVALLFAIDLLILAFSKSTLLSLALTSIGISLSCVVSLTLLIYFAAFIFDNYLTHPGLTNLFDLLDVTPEITRLIAFISNNDDYCDNLITASENVSANWEKGFKELKQQPSLKIKEKRSSKPRLPIIARSSLAPPSPQMKEQRKQLRRLTINAMTMNEQKKQLETLTINLAPMNEQRRSTIRPMPMLSPFTPQSNVSLSPIQHSHQFSHLPLSSIPSLNLDLGHSSIDSFNNRDLLSFKARRSLFQLSETYNFNIKHPTTPLYSGALNAISEQNTYDDNDESDMFDESDESYTPPRLSPQDSGIPL